MRRPGKSYGITWEKDKKIVYTTTNGDLKKAYSTPSVFMVNGKPQLITPSAEATLALDPKTGEEEDKLHLHWRLVQPTRTKIEHDFLRECNGLTCRLAGGDPTAISLVHQALAG